MTKKALFWFRSEIRIRDNPGFYEAALSEKGSSAVLPVYIFDNRNNLPTLGSASQVWLRHSLESLSTSLDENLAFYAGDPLHILQELVKKHEISAVYWNRSYEPAMIQRDKIVKKTLEENGITCRSFNASLLWEPWNILKLDQTPYKVFTPFYRKGCLAAAPPRAPFPTPKGYTLIPTGQSEQERSTLLEKQLPTPIVRWDIDLKAHWEIGEIGAQKRWHHFLRHGLDGYKEGRNFPNQDYVSRLSPHLHFGEISPYQLWHDLQEQGNTIPYKDKDHFLSELGWREFSYYLLYHFPDLPQKNFQPKFDRFPWQENENFLRAWQRGKTGYPIVDAGMRELWQTGYMHNRVRMIVGSFLVKNLLLHWHHGEAWFWDCLVDADLANNSASWQWIAGSGADAAPYFRIFNPITQGQKFDPEGEYTKRFVPELKNLPKKYLFAPWEAPTAVLAEAGITLGKEYPAPIVNLPESRDRALDAFAKIKEQ